MAKGEKVAAKFETYVAGMETDPAFEAVSFFREVPVEVRGDTKAVNKVRSQLISEVSKQYGVKPLGAAAAPGKTLDKALIQTLWAKAKGDADRVARAYALRNPAHELTAEKVLSICSGVDQTAKDLLAQV